jgi:hypothetical protein
MTQRLSAQEFIAEIKRAPGWAVMQNPLDNELELAVMNDGEEVKRFLGPKLAEMTDLGVRAFLAEVRKVTNIPGVHRNRVA